MSVTLTSPTAIVHVEYDPLNIPPPPSDKWTRFVCISDTHSHTFEVPPGDVLLHSGDLTNTGTLMDFTRTMEWIYALPHRRKILIAGNHDLTLHNDFYVANWERWHRIQKQRVEPIWELLKGAKAKAAGVVYLQDEEYHFQIKSGGRKWSVYGSPWSPEFCDWAFGYPVGEEGEALVSKLPKTDILLTHGPPYDVFDRTNRGVFAGCKALADRLPSLRPRLHVFGHIHEAHGAHIHKWSPDSLSTPSVQFEMPNTEDNVVSPVPVPEAETTTPHTDEETDHTVFVNAANWPSGPRAYAPGRNWLFGGPGFRAVIIDMKD